LLELFQSEFHKTEKEASDLLMSSIYLFGDGQDAISKPETILLNSLSSFNHDKARSVISLLTAIANIDDKNRASKTDFIAKVEATFNGHFKSDTEW